MEIRADIGTADTPALPISGLIFLLLGNTRLNILTNNTPEAEAMINAMKPKAKIPSVLGVKNSDACVDAPTVIPNRIVTMSHKGPLAVLAKREVTPLSRSKLPKNNIPNNGRPEGTKKQVSSNPIMGNIIFSF